MPAELRAGVPKAMNPDPVWATVTGEPPAGTVKTPAPPAVSPAWNATVPAVLKPLLLAKPNELNVAPRAGRLNRRPSWRDGVNAAPAGVELRDERDAAPGVDERALEKRQRPGVVGPEGEVMT